MDKRKLVEGRSIRWDEARARSAYDAGLWVRQTLGDALEQAAEQTPERTLIVDGEVRIDSKTLLRQVQSLANSLLTRAAPGSVISFMLPNWHEAATIYLATQLAGMVANPILPSLRDRDLTYLLADTQSRVVFIPEQFRGHDYAGMLSRVCTQLREPPGVVVVRGDAREHTPYAALFSQVEQQELPSVDPDAARLLLYTSGTTGTPKGVLHSQNTIHALVKQIGRYWHVAPGNKFFVASPISHIGGSIYTFEAPLWLGSTAVLVDKWDATSALEVILREGCTHMAGATPFLQQLLAAAQQAHTHLPNLKVFICGGASVPPSLIRNAASHFHNTIFTRVYGSTEVPVTTVGAPDRATLDHAAETDGRVGIGEVKLVGNPGEIRARGPQMLIGYLHPEDEADVFDDEGYYRTGDLGRWVDQSYLVVAGRTKDIIIRKGENISPKEVEDMLVEHPNIAEVAIVGLPDPERGELACAAIVPKTQPGPDVSDLRAYCTKLGIASFKIPEQVVLLDSLPKNDAGKVLKHAIRAQLIRETHD
jgi:cyclohexanecarboxylate-CoA ligase